MNLTVEQLKIVEDTKDKKLVVAGPGTGKTTIIIGLVKKLIESGVSSQDVTILTFTKSNTSDFIKKLVSEFGKENLPRVNNIHSFALKELISNHAIQGYLPTPIRIANDFEQEIIYEDIKTLLNVDKKTIKTSFDKLSAGWENLNADKKEWENSFSPDAPKFIGAYREHREIYGYTLRAELVYRFKQFLENTPEYKPKQSIRYLIVDEYQDLNRCDQKVINFLVKQTDCQLFCAGDDDQSIYGFRYAYPEGVRQFSNDYPDYKGFELKECFRCDRQILSLATAIIGQDFRRIPKALESTSKNNGIVKIYRFSNGNIEAEKIARLTQYLIKKKNIKPNQILILLRNDSRKVFSAPIVKSLLNLKIEVNSIDWENIWKSPFGQYLLSLVKYKLDGNDSLAIRTILELTPGLGSKTYLNIYNKAKQKGTNFSSMVNIIIDSKNESVPNKSLLTKTISNITDLDFNGISSIDEQIKTISGLVPPRYTNEKEEILKEIGEIIKKESVTDLKQLLSFLNNLIDSNDAIMDENKVNIMTMHKAKGLSSEVVIIPALEDEIYRPDCDTDEERRLLYVSLTRAKNYLIMSYSQKRSAPQCFSGTGRRNVARTISRFFKEMSLKIENGDKLFSKS